MLSAIELDGPNGLARVVANVALNRIEICESLDGGESWTTQCWEVDMKDPNVVFDTVVGVCNATGLHTNDPNISKVIQTMLDMVC